MFIFVTCDVSPFAGFAWFLARAVLKTQTIVGVLPFVRRINTTIESLEARKLFQFFSFCKKFKFHAQLSRGLKYFIT